VTRIDFYRYADDRNKFACMLASKAFAAGNKVCVFTADSTAADQIDRLLWTYQQLKFVPHCRKGAAVEAETPVIVLAAGEEPPHHDVLINLADAWPAPFASFERMLEVVSSDDADKARARDRYKFYKERGYEINVHDVAADAKK
jgi:DNA polymerase-3 subunit chi